MTTFAKCVYIHSGEKSELIKIPQIYIGKILMNYVAMPYQYDNQVAS